MCPSPAQMSHQKPSGWEIFCKSWSLLLCLENAQCDNEHMQVLPQSLDISWLVSSVVLFVMQFTMRQPK